ncbi:MAG: CHAD domain-containing protein, partial [Dongiaceae bacterium]
MADEIELKLMLPQASDGKKAAYSPAKVAAAFGLEQPRPAKTQHLQSTYFDTDDEWLRRQGMALRIRRIGRQRLQTLKAPTVEVTGAQAYREIETPVIGDMPDLALITEPDLFRRLMEEDLSSRLAPAFITDFRRTTWNVDFDGAQIELALDRGQVIAGDRQQPILEVELELKQGEPAALFGLAQAALGRLPFCLGHQSKAARGYHLRAGWEAGAVKSSAFELSETSDVGNAFNQIVGHCLTLLHANEQAVIDNENPEGIHQFRVALRRLRSIVRAYRDLMDEGAYQLLSSELRWLQGQFGPARDLDVFIADTLRPIHERFPDQAGLAHLLEIAGNRCQAARHQAHRTLQESRYAGIQLMIYRWLATQSWRRSSATASLSISAPDFAGKLLKRQHKKLRHRGKDGQIPEAQLHELRVAGKKMRYLGEAFRIFYKPRAYKKYNQHLTAIQDCLGALNDAFVGRRLMTDLIADMRSAASLTEVEIEYVKGIIVGWQAGRIDLNLRHFAAVW